MRNWLSRGLLLNCTSNEGTCFVSPWSLLCWGSVYRNSAWFHPWASAPESWVPVTLDFPPWLSSIAVTQGMWVLFISLRGSTSRCRSSQKPADWVATLHNDTPQVTYNICTLPGGKWRVTLRVWCQTYTGSHSEWGLLALRSPKPWRPQSQWPLTFTSSRHWLSHRYAWWSCRKISRWENHCWKDRWIGMW